MSIGQDGALPFNPADLGVAAAANPGITPDAAVASAITPSQAPGIAQASYQDTYQQAATKMFLQMQQKLDAYQQTQTQVDSAPIYYAKSATRNLMSASEATFQEMANATMWGIGALQGKNQQGLSLGNALANNSLSNIVSGVDSGTGWTVDPNSDNAKYQVDENQQLLGGLGGKDPSTLGQAGVTAVGMKPGTLPYGIVSGILDAGTHLTDPSMYVGSGELMAGAKSLVGIGKAADLAKGAVAGVNAAKASNTLDSLSDVIAEHAAAGDKITEAQQTVADQVASRNQVVQELHSSLTPQIQQQYQDATLHSMSADTATGQAALDQNAALLEQLQRQKMDLKLQVGGLKSEASSKIAESQSALDAATASHAETVAANTKPLPEGFTATPVDTAHYLDPTIAQRKIADAETNGWQTIQNKVPEGTPGADHAHSITINDAQGKPAAEMFWNADDGTVEWAATNPAYQRQGLASALFDKATQEAEKLGIKPPVHSTDLTTDGAAFATKQTERASAISDSAQKLADAQTHTDFTKQIYGDTINQARTDMKSTGQAAKKIASLNKAQSETEAQIAALQEARAGHQAFAIAQAKDAAQRAGLLEPHDMGGVIDTLKNIAGLRDAPGSQLVDVDKAIGFVTGSRDVEPIYRAIAGIKGENAPGMIYRMTRGNLDAKMVVNLADNAETSDEARAIFAQGLGSGSVSQEMGHLTALRAASRLGLGGRDLNSFVPIVNKALGGSSRVVQYARQMAKSNVPWAAARNATDADGMAQLTSDTITYMRHMTNPRNYTQENLDFHDMWLSKMLRASSPAERKDIFHQVNKSLIEEAGAKQGLTDERIGQMVEGLNEYNRSMEKVVNYTAEARAASPDGVLRIGNMEVTRDLATLQAEMSTHVMAPNWDLMRQTMKKVDYLDRRVAGNPNTRDVMHDSAHLLMDKFWKPAMLTFRTGYLLRVSGDMQARMFLTNHPSFFTMPQGILGMALAHAVNPIPAVGKALNRAEIAGTDVTGRGFGEVAEENDLQSEMIDGYNKIYARHNSMNDIGSERQQTRLGFHAVAPDAKGFHQGWANELATMHASPIAKQVLQIQRGEKFKSLKQWMNQTGITDRQAAYTDYLTNGPGRKDLNDFLDSSGTLKQYLGTQANLHDFLWNPDNTLSYANRWTRLTLNHDPAVLDALDKTELGAFQARRATEVAQEATTGEGVKSTLTEQSAVYNQRTALGKELRQIRPLKTAEDQAAFPIRNVRSPIYQDASKMGAAGVKLGKAVDWFFEKDAGMQRAATLPEYKFATWDKSSEFIQHLTPEDAQKVAATAQETLGGHLESAWARTTNARVQNAAKNASGDGTLGIQDMADIAHQYATDHVKNMFYDAAQRNQVAHALRLVTPFVQPFVNQAKTFAKLAATNSKQFYKANLAYNAAQGPNTKWINRNDPSDPDNSLIYKDPTTGAMTIGIPLVGSALAAIGSVISKAQGGQAIDPGLVSAHAPTASFYILFQNGLNPGFGPLLTIPASMVDSTNFYQKMVPSYVKEGLIPYTNVDPTRQQGVFESLMPSWASGVMGGLGVAGFSDRVQTYIKPAMASLFSDNSARYLNSQGLMDASGQALLLQDANAMAHGIAFGRGALTSFSPATLQAELLVHDKSGNTLSQSVLTKQFHDIEGQTGSREIAFAELVKQYGLGPIMTMLPNKEFNYTPTTQAWEYTLNNPESGAKNAAVLPLFLPGGGYSALLARLQNARGENSDYTPGQVVANTNSMLHEAQVGQLQEQLVAGTVNQDQYAAQLKTLNAAYAAVPQVGYANNSTAQAVSEVQTALQDPTLAATQAGHAASVYLAVRQQALAQASGGSLGGKSDAPLRAGLRNAAASLIQQYPQFVVMFTSVFKSEVKN